MIVTTLALAPGEQLPHFFSFWDKAQHVLAFGVLGFLGGLSYPTFQYVVFFALATYGACLEVIQGGCLQRTASLEDWLADLLGLVLAYGFIRWAGRKPVLRCFFPDQR